MSFLLEPGNYASVHSLFEEMTYHLAVLTVLDGIQAFAQGATEIGWHYWATNTPSIATALKPGFEKVLDYPVYYGQYRTVLT